MTLEAFLELKGRLLGIRASVGAGLHETQYRVKEWPESYMLDLHSTDRCCPKVLHAFEAFLDFTPVRHITPWRGPAEITYYMKRRMPLPILASNTLYSHRTVITFSCSLPGIPSCISRHQSFFRRFLPPHQLVYSLPR